MKTYRLLLVLFASLAAALNVRADVIARWNFNSPIPDGSSSTGSALPSEGIGKASLIGGVTASFATGDAKAEPGVVDNSAWNTAGYPAQNASNRTAGVRFEVDTRGYENITLSWTHRHSGSASRYLRVQASDDAASYVDVGSIGLAVHSVFTNFSFALGATPGFDNNPNFSFQVVSEFEFTAAGAGTNGYVATDPEAKYGTTGTIRFDMVTVSGTPIAGANTPPTLSALSNQTVRVSASTARLPITLQDAQDAPEALVLTGVSSDQAIVPDANILFFGSGQNREVQVRALDRPGAATITLTVTDTGGRSASTDFTLTILPLNTPPVISALSFTNALADHAAGPIPFTIGDLETPAPALTLTGTSGNSDLIPDWNIGFGGGASNRTVTVMPLPGRSGAVPITLTVSDGTNHASTSFPVLVTPSPFVLLCDSFSYPDGSLLTNSAWLWDHRSGTVGECAVQDRKLVVKGATGEDVTAPLLGAPWARSNGTVLYASFNARFLGLPAKTPGYFAHFGSGSNLRGRVFAGTTNAAPDRFRLFVANGSDLGTEFPRDLETNVTLRVVTRYDIDQATTTLWLDPSSEADPSVAATDDATPVTLSAYGFRQDASVGATVLVDDLIVGLTFAAVMPPDSPPGPIRLGWEAGGESVVLSWGDSRFRLQSAPGPGEAYTDVPGAKSPFTNSVAGVPRFFRLRAN